MDDTSCFGSSWGGEDDWVGPLPDRFQSPGRDPFYPNQVSWLELVGRFRGGRWQDSLHCLANSLVSFLQNLQGLVKGIS